MNNDNMSSATKHLLQLATTLLIVGVAWGTLTSKVDALQENRKDVRAELKLLQNDVNKQAVTIGGIVVITKNIEKQMETQQRLLERISEQLTRPN